MFQQTVQYTTNEPGDDDRKADQGSFEAVTFEAGWVSTSSVHGSRRGVEDLAGCDEYAGAAQGSLSTFSNGPSSKDADGGITFAAAAGCAVPADDRLLDFWKFEKHETSGPSHHTTQTCCK
jgi:hypothetical protein